MNILLYLSSVSVQYLRFETQKFSSRYTIHPYHLYIYFFSIKSWLKSWRKFLEKRKRIRPSISLNAWIDQSLPFNPYDTLKLYKRNTNRNKSYMFYFQNESNIIIIDYIRIHNGSCEKVNESKIVNKQYCSSTIAASTLFQENHWVHVSRITVIFKPKEILFASIFAEVNSIRI